MRYVSLAALIGINSRVGDSIAKQLRSNNIIPIFIKSDNQFDDAYFRRLLDQVDVTLKWETSRGGQIDFALVSFLEGEALLEKEAEYFMLSARRLSLKPQWRNNPSSANVIRDAIVTYVQSSERKTFNQLIRSDQRMLLPRRNCGSRAVTELFDKIFRMEAAEIVGRAAREIAYVRKKKSFRIRGVDFLPQVNSGKHPIRRCSDTKICDLAAAFRFGVRIEERMEFDVTCEAGLRDKTFYQCDGSRKKINLEPTHLNMRINDDFEIA